MKEIVVTKRNGSEEPLDIEKIHRVLNWACEGVDDVSTSEIEAQAKLKFHSGIKTSELHQSLVDSAHELICEDTPNYDLVSGRLAMFDLRKRVYNNFEVPDLYDIVVKNIADGWYHPELLGTYTRDEWKTLNNYINHDLDFNFRICGAREWMDKYLVQNRVTGEFKETPQVAYMLVSAILMKRYVADDGIKIVLDYYDDLSKGDTSIPSPVAAGIRTPKPQGASCTLIEVGDDLGSIGASAQAILLYASNKAGLGIGVQNLRAAGQPIRQGDATTTGPIPFAQFLQSAVSSCSQGGMRKGSATFFHNIWHKDVESLLVLKNSKGTEETRIRHADHAFNMNGYMLRKILKGELLTLFSPEEVPDMHAAFYADQPLFAELYEKYSDDTTKNSVKIDGKIIRDLLVNERTGTSRIYLHFVDNTNQQGSYDPIEFPVRQSNLCLEIVQATRPIKSLDDPDGLISLCNLSALNWGRIKKPSDFKGPARRAVFALDSLLEYQPYLLPAARNSTDWFRNLGIGVTNFAYFLAKRGLKYNKAALETVDEYMEAMSFYLISASVELAERYGPCQKYMSTKYGRGEVPFDNRKKTIDELVPAVLRQDWAPLKARLKKSGIRNAVLMANMPAETSSRGLNMTNGGEPVRALITTKGGTKMVVPEFHKLRNKYDQEWDVDLDGYIDVQMVKQKWMDQAISLNTRYDPSKHPNNMIPAKVILNHITRVYKYGGKTMYYNNLRQIVANTEEEVIEDEIECPSCTV